MGSENIGFDEAIFSEGGLPKTLVYPFLLKACVRKHVFYPCFLRVSSSCKSEANFVLVCI